MKHTTMKHPMVAGLAVLFTSLTVQGAEPTTASDTLAAKTNSVLHADGDVPYLIGRGTNYQHFTWDTTCPTGCPFSASSYRRLQFTGRWATYTAADTFYPTWGAMMCCIAHGQTAP